MIKHLDRIKWNRGILKILKDRGSKIKDLEEKLEDKDIKISVLRLSINNKLRKIKELEHKIEFHCVDLTVPVIDTDYLYEED